MKILFVIDSLGSGGAQRQFVNIVNGLSDSHDVSVFLYNANSDFYRDDLLAGIPVHHAERNGKKGFSFRVLKALRRQMNSSDVVVSFLPTANIYCALAGLGMPPIRHISCEMSVVNETESWVRRIMANVANYLSKHVVCNSYAQAGYIRALPGMSTKVSTVWNGCKDLPFSPKTPDDVQALSFVVVGRIAYPKNGLRLLQALHIFHERRGFVPRVSWAGRDDSDGRSMLMKRQMLAFLNAHPHVNEKFHFFGEVSDIDSLYAQADTLMSASIYEGVPVVICEAMLSGCSVIASRISDNEIILGQGEERGFLCDPLSPADICAAIERRLDTHPAALEQLTREARAYAAEKFSIQEMVDGYRRVIEMAVH